MEPDETGNMEEELRELEPAEMGELLGVRIVMDVEREKERLRLRRLIWRRVLPIGAVAAVLMAGVFVVFRGGGQEVSKVAEGAMDFWERLEPMEAKNVLRETSAGEIVFVGEEALVAYREVYLDYEDAYRWRDPVTAAELTVYQPRREVRYEPVMIY